MLCDPARTTLIALNIGAMAALMMLASATSAASNGDSVCRDSPEFLEQKFAASGMQVATNTLVTLVRNVDADYEERYLSLLVLGCSGDQNMAPIMLEALNDANPEVRMGVIIGMRYLRSPQAIPPMIAIVRDPSDDENLRQVTSSVLAQIAADSPDAAAAIGEAARDTAQNLNVRLNHVFSLGRMTSDASTEVLKELLEDDNPDMLATTAIALAQHGVVESVPYLVDAVLSPYPQFWLKAKAARYLEQLVDRDFGFTTGNGFRSYFGGAAKGDELGPALAEIHDWWQENRERYQ